MNKKIIIIYIIILIVILLVVFASQRVASVSFVHKLIPAVTNPASAFLSKGTNLVIPSIYSKIGQDVQNGGEAIQNVIDQGKQKISDAQKNIENYFSGISDAVQGKTDNTCTPSN